MTKHPDKPFGLVVWEDAWMRSTGEGGVSEDEIARSPVICHLYGWIVRQDDRAVTVAAEWTPEDQSWRLVAVIPKRMVVSIELFDLKKPRAPRKKRTTQPVTTGAMLEKGAE